MSLPKEPEVTLQLALDHGLTADEFDKIKAYLGRVPTFTELGVYSVMWSEHCSYKNSIKVLKTLPNKGPQLLVGAGEENAGLVDIGDGLACAFKIESHNHPSAVEPYQGAATGVGGIHRDIFTMGARPIAALNSLRFGSLETPRVRFLLDGVVHGIADYGNSFGVPTVAGDIFFDASYEGNPLVNAMSVGIVKAGETASAAAPGPGNPVIIVGASTGRDGIHGATFASEEISEESESKRPSVQVGDPFMEKLLLEATLEAIKTGAIAGIQDMGAAGISCSSSEMSAKSKTGMRIDLDKAPQRESGMTAYEMLLSESQERMLIVAHNGREQEVLDVFQKWDVSAEIIGEVIDTGEVEYWMHGQLKAKIPADSLVLGGGAPVYERETKEPAYIAAKHAFDMSTVPEETNYEQALLKLLQSPNVASKRWVFEQYDHMVRTNTVLGPGHSDAGVIRVKGTKKGLVVKTDCNGRYVYLNPRKGGQIAVAEAARNVVCSGAKPLAITNCLNFGNPYKPEVYWVFKEAVGGMSDACRALNTPVTGGNVSFYNENPKSAVFPTPTIGMLGLIEDLGKGLMTPGYKDAESLVIYAGAKRTGLGGSEYLSWNHGLTEGDAPDFDLEYESKLHQFILNAIELGLIKSAHDCSDGGLIACLAEKSVFSKIGAKIDTTQLQQYSGSSRMEVYFSEAQSGVVMSVSKNNFDALIKAAGTFGIALTNLGATGGSKLVLDETIDVEVEKLHEVYEGAIPAYMNK
ncbi:MAG: phosphoribosylformylglycinamidine synthase subunit PurL [Balneolia bacterium]|nr:phosphoribosylformylglycinamidine synthase subunit PurL [Balneolia bacterium]